MSKNSLAALIVSGVVVVGGVIGFLIYQGSQERKALQAQLIAMQAEQAATAERARVERVELERKQAAEAEANRLEREALARKQAAEAEKDRLEREALATKQAAEAERARQDLESLRAQQAREAEQARLERDAIDRRVAAEAEFDRRLASVRDLKSRAEQLATEANTQLRAFGKAPSSETMSQFMTTARRFFGEAKTMAKEFRAVAEFLSQAPVPDQVRTSLGERLATVRTPVEQLEMRALRGQSLTDAIRTRSVTVAANQDWQTSGLVAQRGEHIRLNPSGQWIWGTLTAKWTDHRGQNAGFTYRIVKELNNAALLCRVGGGGVYPGWGGFDADRVGEVDFRINDAVVSDNHGQMNVEIWILPAGMLDR